MRFSALRPRNALATLRSTPLTSIGTSPVVITSSELTTTFGHSRSPPSSASRRSTSPPFTARPKKHDAKIGPQVVQRNAGDLLSLAADKGYDAKAFRDELREN